MKNDETADSAPATTTPGSPQMPPPIPTGPPALEPSLFHGVLFFLSGMTCLLVVLMFAHSLGDKRDTTVISGTEVVVVGLVIAYFAISAAGMAWAESKAALIKFALAAYLALFILFAFLVCEPVAEGALNRSNSLYNILLAVTEFVSCLALLLLPWHIVWLRKLRAEQ